MTIQVSFNGANYSVPEEGETGWFDLTDLIVALTAAATANSQANGTNPSFSSAALVPNGTIPSAANLQSATVTLAGGNSYAFVVSLNSGESLVLASSFATATVTAVSDPSGLFLATDSGTGIYVGKSAGSAVLTFRNRTGSAKNIDIRFLTNTVSSATAWS